MSQNMCLLFFFLFIYLFIISQDFHTKRYGQPDLDAQQDWNLKYGYEENGKSIFGIIRKLETCDTNDLPITVNFQIKMIEINE